MAIEALGGLPYKENLLSIRAVIKLCHKQRTHNEKVVQGGEKNNPCARRNRSRKAWYGINNAVQAQAVLLLTLGNRVILCHA